MTDSANDQLAAFDRQGSELVFVLSLPRSGSTLLQRILGGHPMLHTEAEPWFMLHSLYALRTDGHEAEYNAALAREALKDFLDVSGHGDETYIRALREMAAVLYGNALARSGKKRFVDKTPRYHYIISELYRTFPKAEYVFLLRNPLAVMASVLDSWFGNNPEALRQAPDHWSDLQTGWQHLRNGIRHVGAAGICLHYEDLVREPESTIRRLCTYLAVPFTPEMIEYGRGPGFSGRFGDQIGIPKHERPVTDSLEKWRTTLSKPASFRAASEYLNYLGPCLLQDLGYDLDQLASALHHAVVDAADAPESLHTLPARERAAIARMMCQDIDPALAAEDFSSAIEIASQALRLSPECADAELVFTELSCAVAEHAFAEGNLDIATRRLWHALSLVPRCIRAINDMGAILWQQERRLESLERFRQAFDLNPGDDTSFCNTIDALSSLGREGDAKTVCMTRLANLPDDALAMQRLCTLGSNTSQTETAQCALTFSATGLPTFSYSRRSHFVQLGLPPEHSGADLDDCDLKIYQDTLLYHLIKSNFKPGARLLEIGGGDSRIIRWLKEDYDFWNLDKLEGAGNGLTHLPDEAGFTLVRDYIGAFNHELPDASFDCVFSLSTLEHVPEDQATLKSICEDIQRLLKPGGLSLHSIDILMKAGSCWMHPLIDYMHIHIPGVAPRAPEWLMRADPDTWGMSERAYERLWKPITMKPFHDFGTPMAYNVFWKKAP